MTHHHIVMDENEFNFVRDAVMEKYDRLTKKLVLHEEKPTLEDAAKITKAEFESELGRMVNPMNPFFYKRVPKWGYKKDGTPKKTRGRPVKGKSE